MNELVHLLNSYFYVVEFYVICPLVYCMLFCIFKSVSMFWANVTAK